MRYYYTSFESGARHEYTRIAKEDTCGRFY